MSEKFEWTEEELEKVLNYIRENRDKLNWDTEDPSAYHGTHFLNKLAYRFRKAYISIVPHLTKLAVTTIVVFTLSFLAWGNWINPDRDKKTYGSISYEHRIKELNYKTYILISSARVRLHGDWNLIKYEVKDMDNNYDKLQIELKKFTKSVKFQKKIDYKIKSDTLQVNTND